MTNKTAIPYYTDTLPSLPDTLSHFFRAGMDIVTVIAARTTHSIGLWHHRARSRRQLRHLEARLLHDIGISQLAAIRESEKPFWRG